jgi:hypothetical protein
MVQRLAPPFSRSDSYPDVFLNLVLPDEVGKVSGAQAGVKSYVLIPRLTGNNAVYLTHPSLSHPIISHLSGFPRKPEIFLGVLSEPG